MKIYSMKIILMMIIFWSVMKVMNQMLLVNSKAQKIHMKRKRKRIAATYKRKNNLLFK